LTVVDVANNIAVKKVSVSRETLTNETKRIETHTHTQPFYGSVDFVRDNLGGPVPEETSTY